MIAIALTALLISAILGFITMTTNDLQAPTDELQPQTVNELPFYAEARTNWINSVCYSPDGTQLAAGTDTGRVYRWDSATGQFSAGLTLPEQEQYQIFCLDWSHDGKHVLAGCKTGKNYLLDAATFSIEHAFKNQNRSQCGIDISPDGSEFLFSNPEGLQRWDIATRALKSTLTNRQGSVRAGCFSPDGSLIAASFQESGDDESDDEDNILLNHRIFVWKTETFPTENMVIDARQPAPFYVWRAWELPDVKRCPGLKFSPDGKSLAACRSDFYFGSGTKTLTIWNVDQNSVTCDQTWSSAAPGVDIAWSPDGRYLAVNDSFGEIRVFDIAKNRFLPKASIPGRPCQYSIISDPDTGFAAVSYYSSDLASRNPFGTRPTVSMQAKRLRGWFQIAWSPDGKQIACGGMGNTVRIWQIK